MRTFIAEKPSLAEAIAGALAEQAKVTPTKNQYYWTVGDDRVTWLFGHLYSGAEPEAYDPKLKQWSLSTLPICLTSVSKLKRVPNPEHAVRLEEIKKLLKASTAIINCGDAEREGQLLVDEVIQELGFDPFANNVYRLWSRSVTRKDMLLALNTLSPNSKYKPLYDCAVARSIVDWGHGMTYSRLFTLLARHQGSDTKITVGRVQTPTLRLIVDRDRERETFTATDYYIPVIKCSPGNFIARWECPDEIQAKDKWLADRILKSCLDQPGIVTKCEASNKSITQPLPFSLSALQTECSAKLGLSAKETLDVAQSLYERHKATTYPRSDSRYLPLSIYHDEAPQIIKTLIPAFPIASSADLGIKSAVWDDSKISDHHGIIPTTEFTSSKLSAMTENERAVFTIIAKAFMSQFFGAYKYKSTTATINIQAPEEKEGHNFIANGQQVLEKGWKAVYETTETKDSEEEEAEQTLPRNIDKGFRINVIAGEVQAKRTKPKPAFTDGLLINAMANIHKFLIDQGDKSTLKEVDGIGTEATRAEILETLLKRGYITRKGKTLSATILGKSLIANLPEDLTSPALTALWERKLTEIRSGNLKADQFLVDHAYDMKTKINAMNNLSVHIEGGKQMDNIQKATGDGDRCPECNIGVMKTKKVKMKIGDEKIVLGCTRYPDCKHTNWDPEAPKLEKLPGHGLACPQCQIGSMKTKLIKFKTGDQKSVLACDNYPNCKHIHSKPKVTTSSSPLPGDGDTCPVCKNGKMITREGIKNGKEWKMLKCNNAECVHKKWASEILTEKLDLLPGDGKLCGLCKSGSRLFTKKIYSQKTGKHHICLGCENQNCTNLEFPSTEREFGR